MPSINMKTYFEFVIKLDNDMHVWGSYVAVPIPKTPRLLQVLFTKAQKIFEWRETVLELIKIAKQNN